jgi:uridine phosphorylase
VIGSVRGVPYPNYEGKHDHAALTEPAAFVRYWVEHGVLPADHRAPEGVVMLYQRSVLDGVRASAALSPFAPRGRRNTAFLDLHVFDVTGGAVGVIGGFGIGAPAAVATMESLAAIGVRSFIGIGTAGALQRGLDTGDVVVCDRAVRDEGVSHHYLPSARFADSSPALTARLLTALEAAGVAPTTGTAWTIDAPFRETVVEARHYADDGVAVVEMEAAALFTVGAVRGVEVASAFAISDSLADGEWVPQFGDPRLGDRLATMVTAAVAALSASPSA